MIRKNRANRIYLICTFIFAAAAIVYFILQAMNKNIDLYLTPTQAKSGQYEIDGSFKLGGMVAIDSIETGSELDVTFVVTDFKNSMTVNYSGVLPSLFKENSGVVASGFYDQDAEIFVAEEILAKHDEKYMPIKIEVEN